MLKSLEQRRRHNCAKHRHIQRSSKITKNPDRVHLIHNGVDTTKFHPSLDGRKIRDQYDLHGKFVVFTARHHRCVYGVEYLIRSAPIVLKKRNDVVYIIGGDGPQRPHLTNLAKALGVEKHHLHRLHIQRPNTPLLRNKRRRSSALTPRGVGLAVTEAMATGKLVIGARVGVSQTK